MTVWMVVTLDEYALPVYIADSLSELEKITGASQNSIRTNARAFAKGKRKSSRYREVIIEDYDDDINER